MKILYVLVCDNSNYFYEQAHVSILSLKHHNPDAFISLLLDKQTLSGLTQKQQNDLFGLVNEYKAIELNNKTSSMLRSRHLKTTMRHHIEGDFLYVDVDTIWADSINSDEFTDSIMGVPDGHCKVKDHLLKNFITTNHKTLKFTPDFPYHINSGVLFMKDTPQMHAFSQKWHELWKQSCEHNVFIDQPALNQTNYLMGNIISLLPGAYNAQISRNWFYYINAKIIHYYTGSIKAYNIIEPPFLFQKTSFWKKVKVNGISSDILKMIKSSQEAFDSFDSFNFLCGKEDFMLRSTNSYGFLTALYTSKKPLAKTLLRTLEWFLKWTSILYTRFFIVLRKKI